MMKIIDKRTNKVEEGDKELKLDAGEWFKDGGGALCVRYKHRSTDDCTYLDLNTMMTMHNTDVCDPVNVEIHIVD